MTKALQAQIRAEAPFKVNARVPGVECALALSADLQEVAAQRKPLAAQPPLLRAGPLAGAVANLVQRQAEPEEEIQTKLKIGPPDDEYERASHAIQREPAIAGDPDYQPKWRPHVPVAPTIPEPPVPAEQSAPNRCPVANAASRILKDENIERRLEDEMVRRTNISRARASRGTIPQSRRIVVQAEGAIRQEFGRLLPSGRDFSARQAVTVLTPSDFAAHRVPDPSRAVERLGEIALTISEEANIRPAQQSVSEVLRNLCIASPTNSLLKSEVTSPLFNRLGINFIREYERYRIGGETGFRDSATPHVTLPSESRNMGHITVHEAMHFYVSDIYRATAEAHALQHQLMEGGAEFLARQVIHQRLRGVPEFQINYDTYSDEFSYVSNNLLRGGLDSFSLAYFQGRTDLLGLPPRSIMPKLAIGQPNDVYEQEADRVAEQVVSMRQPRVQRVGEEEEEELQTKPEEKSTLLRKCHKVIGQEDAVSAGVDRVLSGSGRPLETKLQREMGQRFGHDFSRVRVHYDAAAGQSARDLNAHAYTLGHNIVFGAGRYTPESHEGRRLIAHELTHVVQQQTLDTSSTLRREPDQFGHSIRFAVIPSCPPRVEVLGSFPDEDIANELYGDSLHLLSWSGPYIIDIDFDYLLDEWKSLFADAVPVLSQSRSRGTQPWRMCRGRSSSTRTSGFTGDTAGTYIREIQVDIHPNAYSRVTLSWANGNLSNNLSPTNTFNASPGAGNCDRDCSRVADSQARGSHCTPIGSFYVQGYQCSLGDPKATFVTWFKIERGIAFHNYDVPNHPESHGCVRLVKESRGAEWIYDNTLAGITEVRVNRNASEGPGPKCYRGGRLIDRPSMP